MHVQEAAEGRKGSSPLQFVRELKVYYGVAPASCMLHGEGRLSLGFVTESL